MGDSSWFRNVIRRWRGYIIAGALGSAPFFAWVIHDYRNIREHVPMMVQDLLVWARPAPAPTKEATTPPAPPPATEAAPTKAESKRIVTGALPCIANISAMVSMLEAAGGDFERTFDGLFKRRPVCVTLQLTGAGTLRLEFATRTLLNLNPTVYVEPAGRADLRRFARGDRVRIHGRFARFKRTGPNEPDEIYIRDARLSKAE